MPPRPGALAWLAILVLWLAGCTGATRRGASSGDQAAVRSSVRGFVAAVSRGDLRAACSALDPQFAGRLGCGTAAGPGALDLRRAHPDPGGLRAARAGLEALQIRHLEVRNISPKVIGADVNVAWSSDPRRLTTTYHLTKPGPFWLIDDIALGPPAGQD